MSKDFKEKRVKERDLTAIEATKLYYLAKQAKDPSWRPYCLAPSCKSGHERMIRTSYGFCCTKCSNKRNRDMTTYRGSL